MTNKKWMVLIAILVISPAIAIVPAWRTSGVQLSSQSSVPCASGTGCYWQNAGTPNFTTPGGTTTSLIPSGAQGLFLMTPSGSSGLVSLRAPLASEIPSLAASYCALGGCTFTGPLTLSGTQLGTYTLGGTPTIASPTITGTTSLPANATLSAASSATNTTGMQLSPNVADGATSVALDVNNGTTLATSGALLFRIRNNGSLIFTCDKNATCQSAGGSIRASTLDQAAASPLTVGGTNATAITIGKSTVTTTIAGPLASSGTTFASLGTPSNGTIIYCSDCTIAATCAGSGTGAIAKRLNATWVCN